jgi:hypothetical protein
MAVFNANTSHVKSIIANYMLCYLLKKSLSNFGFSQGIDKQQLTNVVFNTVTSMKGVK